LCALCRREGIWYISDELYHGISFEAEEASALRFDDAQGTTIVVNSFSKYYSMTGNFIQSAH
jgi:aspartate/methionine/tyrosine aminotransferase